MAEKPETTQDDLSTIGDTIVEYIGPEDMPYRAKAVTAVAGTIGVLAAATAVRYGAPLFNPKFVPNVPVVPQIAEGIRRLNDTIRAVAPGAFVGGLCAQLSYATKGRVSRTDRAASRMAKHEYRPLIENAKDNKKGARPRRIRRGLALAAISATLISAATGIEDEVSNGPGRPINTVFSMASDAVGPGEVGIIAQYPEATFMNDSSVPSDQIISMQEKVRELGGISTPLGKNLPQIKSDRSGVNIAGLAIAVDGKLFNSLAGTETGNAADINTDCIQNPVQVIAGRAIGAKTGDILTLNGVNAEVVGIKDDLDSMNRGTVIAPIGPYTQCVKHENPDTSSAYGLLTHGLSKPELQDVAKSTEGNTLSALTQKEFIENNRSFWKNNGTPIILQLMAYLAGYAAVADKKSKRASLQASIREVGSLDVAGVKSSALKKIETIKALREGAGAAMVAVAAAPMFAAAINAAEFGLKVGIGFREIAVGYLFTTAAKVYGGRRAVGEFAKEINTSEVIR